MACVGGSEDCVFERGLAAANRNCVSGYDDLVNDEAQVGAPECRFVLPQPALYELGKARENFRRHFPARLRELLFETANLDPDCGQPRIVALQALLELRILGTEFTQLDEFQEAHFLAFDTRLFCLARFQRFPAFGERAVRSVEHCGQEQGKAIRREDALLKRRQYDVVHQFHRHRRRGAGLRIDRPFPSADKVAVLAAFTGPEDHSGAASCCAAFGKASGESRRVDGSGRGYLGMVLCELRVDLLEIFATDDGGNLDRNPFLRRSRASGSAVGLIVIVRSAVSRATKNVVHSRGAEWFAPDEQATPTQFLGDGDHAGIAVIAAPLEIQVENETYDFSLIYIDDQFLLVLLVQTGGNDGAIAEGWESAVPVSAGGICTHRHFDLFGIYFGLVGIDDRGHAASQIARRTLADLLRNGFELNTSVFELSAVSFEVKVVAVEPAEIPDQYGVECGGATLCIRNHFEEDRPPVIPRGGAGFDINADDLETVCRGVFANLLFLLVQRKLVLGLPAR